MTDFVGGSGLRIGGRRLFCSVPLCEPPKNNRLACAIVSSTMHRVAALSFRALCSRAAIRARPIVPGYLPRPPTLPQQSCNFTHSPALYKKKDKPKRSVAPEPEATSNGSLSDDPFDLSQLHNGIATAAARLKDDLSKLRAGGRFNTATLEGLKVQLTKESKDVIRLGDLAQVVPKGGRTVTVLAADEDVSFSWFQSNSFRPPLTD